MGQFSAEPAKVAEALGLKGQPSISGRATFRSFHLTSDLNPAVEAIKRCSDGNCSGQVFTAFLGSSDMEFVMAQADLTIAGLPRNLRRVQVERPFQLIVNRGVLTVEDISVRAGGQQISSGSLRAKADEMRDDIPSRLSYDVALPLAVDWSRLDLKHLSPAGARYMPRTGLLSMQARSEGVMTLPYTKNPASVEQARFALNGTPPTRRFVAWFSEGPTSSTSTARPRIFPNQRSG